MSVNAVGDKVVLMRGDQYKMWMIVKRKAAVAAGIWDACNPELLGTVVRKLVEPEVPTPDDVIGKQMFMDQPEGSTAAPVIRKARMKDLTNDEKEELVFQKTLYTSKVRKHEAELKAHGEFVKDIIGSVDPEFVLQLGDADTAYELLCACQRKYKPTARENEKSVLAKWTKLYEKPNVANIELWIMKWENVYKEGKDMDIPEMVEWRAVNKLLDVIESHVASKFADPIKAMLSNPDYILTFPQLCTQFLIWWRQNADKMKPRGGHSAFSVGQEGDDGPARPTMYGKDSEGRYTHCICGSVEHRLAVCPYVMKELRPAKWAAVREIQEEVDKKIEKREGLRMAIERIRKDRTAKAAKKPTGS